MLRDTRIYLDPYELKVSPVTKEDVRGLVDLSISVSWPYREADWEKLIEVGSGIVAHDDIGRVMGSAMWFPMGPDLATVGGVITSPRLQAHGAGRQLMMHVLSELEGKRGIMLNATKSAYRLYLSLGFQPRATVFQHQGVVSACPAIEKPSGGTMTRDAVPEDMARIMALDAEAYGCMRSDVLQAIVSVEGGRVLLRDGVIRGFSFRRRFGRGQLLGPVVAETQEDAIALISPQVAQCHGQFLRMDTRAEQGALRVYLQACGLLPFDTVATMSLREPPCPSGQATIYGLLAHSLG